MKCQDLINYFIVDRKSGKSFDPYVCMDKYIVAYSNVATDTKQFIINFPMLLVGLRERRYRLILKSK